MELLGAALAKLIHRGVQLHLLDSLVALILLLRVEVLPWEVPGEQVNQHVANGLEIVPP